MTPTIMEKQNTLREQHRGERRARLRDYQSQLLSRMETASTSDRVQSKQLGVIIGQTHYLLNLEEAGEIISLGEITPVPLTQDWYCGLANCRGNLISLIDMERFEGKNAITVNSDCRIVLFASSLSFNAGLIVSNVVGLRNVADMQSQTNSKNKTSVWQGCQYIDSKNQTWHTLNLACLIHDERFLNISIENEVP